MLICNFSHIGGWKKKGNCLTNCSRHLNIVHFVGLCTIISRRAYASGKSHVRKRQTLVHDSGFGAVFLLTRNEVLTCPFYPQKSYLLVITFSYICASRLLALSYCPPSVWHPWNWQPCKRHNPSSDAEFLQVQMTPEGTRHEQSPIVSPLEALL